MSRFPFSKTVGKVTVRGQEESGLESLAVAANDRIKECLKICESVDGKLRAAKLDETLRVLANNYFLTPRYGIDTADLSEIKTMVTKVWNGLSGDVTIKSGEEIEREDEREPNVRSADGAVRIIQTEEKVPKAWPSTKPYHNTVVWLENGCEARAGALRIKKKVITEYTMKEHVDLGIIVIIHEACHKYGGAWDYCYFDLIGSFVDPEISKHELTDKKRALQNADSYAWFMWWVHSLC